MNEPTGSSDAVKATVTVHLLGGHTVVVRVASVSALRQKLLQEEHVTCALSSGGTCWFRTEHVVAIEDRDPLDTPIDVQLI